MPGYRPFPYKGFGGGLNLRDGVDVVQEDQALDLLNVSFTTRGAVSERSGYAKLTSIEGTNRYDSLAAFYKSDGTKQIVAGAGNRLEAISAAGSVLASITTPTANPHYFQRFGGPTAEHLYIANGTDTVQRWTGSVFETPVYVGVTPNGKFLGASTTDNRLVVARFNGTTAGNNPSTVRFSNEGDPTTFATDNYVDLLPGDGEEIMGVATWRDVVVVFKKTKFFVFYGNTVDDDGSPIFNYRPVDAGVGLATSRAKAVAEQGIYFLDRTGIYFTTGNQPSRVSELVEPIFHGTPSVYYTAGVLNDGSLDQVTMIYYNEQLWMSFPAGAAAVNTHNLVFDPFEKWWTLYDIPAGPMVAFRPDAEDELVFGYASGEKHLGRFGAGSRTADDLGVAGINTINNPSFETDSASWAALGGNTITREAVNPKVGSWALKSTMNGAGASSVWHANAGSASVGQFILYGGWVYTDSDWPGGIISINSQGQLTNEVVHDQAFHSGSAGNYQLAYRLTEKTGGVTPQTFGLAFGTGAPAIGSGKNFWVDSAFVFVFNTLAAAQAMRDRIVSGFFPDGDQTGGTWLGTAHASDTQVFLPDIGGRAINAFWQGGWFSYGTPAVKTIRESKIAGSGLVTVSLFRDYRLNPSFSLQRELSSTGALWDGFTWDDGTLWGPANVIQPKAVRRAIRGESFSLRLSNNVLNRSFTVNRFTTHVREVRVPSVVKVS